jgi:hypothetical protein
LIFIDGQAIGHCSTCTITHQSESREHTGKPVASVAAAGAGKWTEIGGKRTYVGLEYSNDPVNGRRLVAYTITNYLRSTATRI